MRLASEPSHQGTDGFTWLLDSDSLESQQNKMTVSDSNRELRQTAKRSILEGKLKAYRGATFLLELSCSCCLMCPENFCLIFLLKYFKYFANLPKLLA